VVAGDLSAADAREANLQRAAAASAAGDLVGWLAAVVAEVRRVAEAAPPGPWRASGDYSVENDQPASPYDHSSRKLEVISEGDYGGGAVDAETVAHIVLNDPRAALAQCEAHTAILGLVDLSFTDAGEPITLGGYGEAYWDVVRLVAAAYRHWPGYREEWKP
jgi:hypothetical protein